MPAVRPSTAVGERLPTSAQGAPLLLPQVKTHRCGVDELTAYVETCKI